MCGRYVSVRSDADLLREFEADDPTDAVKMEARLREAGLTLVFMDKTLPPLSRGRRDLVTVVGHAPTISAGEFVQAAGTWITDRQHGLQFKADVLSTTPPTTRAPPRPS